MRKRKREGGREEKREREREEERERTIAGESAPVRGGAQGTERREREKRAYINWSLKGKERKGKERRGEEGREGERRGVESGIPNWEPRRREAPLKRTREAWRKEDNPDKGGNPEEEKKKKTTRKE